MVHRLQKGCWWKSHIHFVLGRQLWGLWQRNKYSCKTHSKEDYDIYTFLVFLELRKRACYDVTVRGANFLGEESVRNNGIIG